MRITMAQLNPTVGDLEGNVSKALDVITRASADRVDLIVFPELFITGYPLRDLVEQPAFMEETAVAIERIAEASKPFESLGIVIGCPRPTDRADGKGLHNAAILISKGRIEFEQAKSLLPTYDVFDEARYFDPARRIAAIPFKGEMLGLSICEDFWSDSTLWKHHYPHDPIRILARSGAKLIINISASPFTVGKEQLRFELIRNHTRRHNIPFVFVNQVGGNDELVFDGRSLFVDALGEVQAALPSFEEAVHTIDTARFEKGEAYRFEDDVQAVFKALILGTRDYIRKCGFQKVVVGLSGGIDSSVVSVIAAKAIGPENVLTLSMPSPYSSKESIEDAERLAATLGMRIEIIEIAEAMKAYDKMLKKQFEGCETDVTEENIQARIRGNILMAFSNKFGLLPLSTGNKSELAVGYCTLYGDMSGGLAVISDVPKNFVYRLAEYINREGEIIPERVFEKLPSAELRPSQRDQDALPPYDVLDPILEAYIDGGLSLEEIVKEGFDRETVIWIIDAVRKNEFKRRQAPPGLKVTSKAFGSGRRMPIAAKYKG
jgi:NAD+ synthase (glutamine-hydrolysing)